MGLLAPSALYVAKRLGFYKILYSWDTKLVLPLTKRLILLKKKNILWRINTRPPPTLWLKILNIFVKNQHTDLDISFPAYGHTGDDGNMETTFRGFPFVSMVTAPKIAVLVHHHFFDDLRVNVLLRTILDSWPLMVFILFR